MPNVPYLSPGDAVTAQHWNDLWLEADARLYKLYSGLPPCLWGAMQDSGAPWDFARRFYFWSDEMPPPWLFSGGGPADAKSVAQAFFGKLSDGTIFSKGGDPWVRQYSAAPFGDLVALLDLDDPDSQGLGRPALSDDYKVARLRPLTLAEFNAFADSIWGQPGSAVYDSGNALAYSLEVHGKNIGGKDYGVYVTNFPFNAEAEFKQKWIPIDVYIGETFNSDNPLEWPREFNKYQFIRFQNLQGTTAVIQFATTDDAGNPSTFELDIPPMSTKCVRRIETPANGGTPSLLHYEVSPFYYFHAMHPGDPWWLALTAWNGSFQLIFPDEPPTGDLDVRVDGRSHLITDPLKAANMLAKVDTHAWAQTFRSIRELLSPLEFTADGLWNAKPIYNNPGYKGGFKTRPTPAGGYFGDLDDDDTPLGDLVIHKGTVLNARDMGGSSLYDHTILRRSFEFTGFRNLVADLASVGVTVQNPDPGVGDGSAFLFKSAGGGTDGGVLISVSCNLMLALLGKAAELITPTGTSMPGLQGIPIAVSGIQVIEQSADYVAFNESDYTDFHTETVSWTNRVRNVTEETTRKFNLFETIGALKAALMDPALYDGNDAFPSVIEILMTAWGPLLHYSQVLALDFPVPALSGNLLDTNFQFAVVAPDGDFGWTYRNSKCLSLARPDAFYDGQDDPGFGWPRIGMQVSSGGSFVGPDYGTPAIYWPRFWRYWANARFAKHEPATQPFCRPAFDEFGNPINGWSVQHPLVKEWFESKAIEDDKLLPLAQLGLRLKSGISLLGAFDRKFDVFTRMAAWLNYLKLKSLSGGALGRGPVTASEEDFSTPEGQSYWFMKFNAGGFQAQAPIDLNGVTQNQLPLEAEHYNAAASVVNGVTGANTSELQPMGITPLGYFFTMTSGRTPGQGLPSSATNVRPWRQWISWQHDLNPEVTAKFAAWGVPIKTSADFPASFNAFCTSSMLFADGLGATSDDGNPESLWGTWAHWVFQIGFVDSYAQWMAKIGNYRWITIEDAIALHERLGIPFVFQETATPCVLLIVDASWSELDTRVSVALHAASPTEVNPLVTLISRGAALVNKHSLFGEFDSETEGDAEWVHDVFPGYETMGPPIRRDVTAPRYSLQVQTEVHSVMVAPLDFTITTTDHLVRAVWGTPPNSIENKLRNWPSGTPLPAGVTSTCPPGKFFGDSGGDPQVERGFVVRRYGCAPCRVVLWSRNYADFQLHFDASLARWGFDPTWTDEQKWQHVPRIAVDGLEGAADPIIDEQGLTKEEFVVVAPAGFVSGEMQVYWDARKLES